MRPTLYLTLNRSAIRTQLPLKRMEIFSRQQSAKGYCPTRASGFSGKKALEMAPTPHINDIVVTIKTKYAKWPCNEQDTAEAERILRAWKDSLGKASTGKYLARNCTIAANCNTT